MDLMPRERLKVWRERKKLTQKALGEQLGCGGDMLHHVEKGNRKPPGALAARIEAVVGIMAAEWWAPESSAEGCE